MSSAQDTKEAIFVQWVSLLPNFFEVQIAMPSETFKDYGNSQWVLLLAETRDDALTKMGEVAGETKTWQFSYRLVFREQREL